MLEIDLMLPRAAPFISIILVDGRFRERFDTIDCLGALDYPTDAHEVLWIDYYEVQEEAHRRLSDRSNMRAISLGREGTYHSSYCFNAGIAASRGEIVVLLDADVMVDPDFLHTIDEGHRANAELAMYIRRFDQPRRAYQPGCESNIAFLKDTCRLGNPTNFGGCLTVRRQWLNLINGYEQHDIFGTGFHANGMDVNVRLRNLGLCVRWHPTARLYHAWHENTLADDAMYRVQKLVIRWRELNLVTTTFVGLDQSRTQPMPSELAAQVQQEFARIASEQGLMHLPTTMRGPARRALGLWRRLRPVERVEKVT
jgi:Glycosyl transferase family 2